jgi:hypothetical protein
MSRHLLVAVALAHGAGAQLSVLRVSDDDDDQPDALSLPLEDVSRSCDRPMPRVDAQMETQMQAFLAGMPTHEPPMTPRLTVGHPRQVIVATALPAPMCPRLRALEGSVHAPCACGHIPLTERRAAVSSMSTCRKAWPAD